MGIARHKTEIRIMAIMAAALLAALFAVAGSVSAGEAQALTPNQKLSVLTVRTAGTMDGYSRDKFSHWTDAQAYALSFCEFVSLWHIHFTRWPVP